MVDLKNEPEYDKDFDHLILSQQYIYDVIEHLNFKPCSFDPTPSKVNAYCVSRNSFASSILSTLYLIKINVFYCTDCNETAYCCQQATASTNDKKALGHSD